MTPRVPVRTDRYYLPVLPLIAAMEADCQGVTKELGSALDRAYHRLKKREEASWITIDHICCALGRHPSSVYGDDWWLLMAEIDEDLNEAGVMVEEAE